MANDMEMMGGGQDMPSQGDKRGREKKNKKDLEHSADREKESGEDSSEMAEDEEPLEEEYD